MKKEVKESSKPQKQQPSAKAEVITKQIKELKTSISSFKSKESFSTFWADYKASKSK